MMYPRFSCKLSGLFLLRIADKQTQRACSITYNEAIEISDAKMTKKILVTGASGFIGSHTVIDLLKNGYEVRGTIRDLSRAAGLEKLFRAEVRHLDNLTLVEANLTDVDCWKKAVEGCDGVFHLASPVPIEQPEDPDELIIPAREGVLNVLKAAADANIKRVVLTSSVAAVSANPGAGETVQSEADWSDPQFPTINAYGLSKTLAERAAWDFTATHDIELITINPAMVLGPALEPDYGSSLEALALLMGGRYPLLPKLSMGIVDVRDVATLHRLAFERGNSGSRLLCSHGHMSLLDIATLLGKEIPTLARKLPRYELPSFIFRILGKFNPVIETIVPDLNKIVEYDCAPAFDLGWQPRPIEEAVLFGARSLIEHGVIKIS